MNKLPTIDEQRYIILRMLAKIILTDYLTAEESVEQLRLVLEISDHLLDN